MKKRAVSVDNANNAKKYFFVEHWHLMTAILFFIAVVLLDLRGILFPELIINAPSMDSCWNMFEAQVGISAVGLTIVSLIISIVSTSTYGMSLPEYIMRIRPKKYLRYTAVIVSIIAAVVINWAMLIFGMEFIAIYIFVLTTVLAVYLTYSAMQIIYVKDDIKADVRKFIAEHKRENDIDNFRDIDNLYKAMSKSIKNGDFIEFTENLELAEELLEFEIVNWETRGKKFAQNLEALIDGAMDTDNNRIPVEIMEFYYNALGKANGKKDEKDDNKKVCIEWLCYKVVLKLFKVIDFDYLENLKINPECTYKEFLKVQLDNHDILSVDLYNENTSNEEKEYALSFFYLHYIQLYYSKYKDKFDSRVYKMLIEFEENIVPESYKDYFRRFFFYQSCFDYPRKECLEELVYVRQSDEERDIKTRLAVNESFNMPTDIFDVLNFSLNKHLYICLLLYRWKLAKSSDDIWYNLAETALANFYRNYYERYISELDKRQHSFDKEFKAFLKEMEDFKEFGEGFGVGYDVEYYLKHFIVYSVMTYSPNAETAVNSLERIFGKETLYHLMYLDFIGIEGYYMMYTNERFHKFADIFGIDLHALGDRFTELKNVIIERKAAFDKETDTKKSDKLDTAPSTVST
ncbi:MAG: hypothetical protein LBM41_01205 [Ruminococcus sp.]|nr:hypothetical protein [Ruminococcus sp.]